MGLADFPLRLANASLHCAKNVQTAQVLRERDNWDTAWGCLDLVTGLVYHPDYVKHDLGIAHPERPERISRTIQYLNDVGLLDDPNIQLFRPEPATIEDLKLVHTTHYIERIMFLGEHEGMLTPDTPVTPRTYEIARLSAGGAILAGRTVVEGNVRNSFALIRPPGQRARYASVPKNRQHE